MFVLAAGLLGLIVLLATLQYRWLGQISNAERTRMSAMLRDNASAFAEDFDRELNRAYLLFQIVPVATGDNLPAQVASRYDRWLATSQYPRMVREVYLTAPAQSGTALRRFNPSTRLLEPAVWPALLAPVRARVDSTEVRPLGQTAAVLHATVQMLWPEVPALVVSAPMLFVDRVAAAGHGAPPAPVPQQPTYCILLFDSDYIRGAMLPALARHHFQSPNGSFDYELAVVPTTGNGVVYHSAGDFNPAATAKADASADLFHLRVQDFGPLVSEISRFTFFSADVPAPRRGEIARTETVIRESMSQPVKGTLTLPAGGMSIVVQQKGVDDVTTTLNKEGGQTNTRFAVSTAPHWRLLVQHPSGSLEQAVNSARRRNLLVSTGILGLLAISVGFLVVSTRRAHDLARQQIEFVATVSHELRTPLAVIRSAADNLADGVVGDETRVRQYGQLVRSEGKRLSELVEQILEFAGLQSGQRALARQPVTLDAVLREVVAAAQTAADAAGVRIEVTIADGLPAVAGDESALRRAFLNLLGNAIKYGAAGRWVGVSARSLAAGVEVAVSDRGIGVAPAEHGRIFEPFYRAPDVVAAQIQGAGLGLSLVRKIVEAHGGRIAVTSAPGEGSTFTVTLPRMTGQPSAKQDGVASVAAQPL
jgi:two-component system sensor histidine kinase SenX3